MPNVRVGRRRLRAACPACGREVSYTNPYFPIGDRSAFARRERDRKIFARHNAPDGTECPGKA
jgi:hypothetical protein